MKQLKLTLNNTLSVMDMEHCPKCFYQAFYECDSMSWSLTANPYKYQSETSGDRPETGWTDTGIGTAYYIQRIDDCFALYENPSSFSVNQRCYYIADYEYVNSQWTLLSSDKFISNTPEERPATGWSNTGMYTAEYTERINDCCGPYINPGTLPSNPNCYFLTYYTCTGGDWQISGNVTKYLANSPEERPTSGWTRTSMIDAYYVEHLDECIDNYSYPTVPYECLINNGSTCAPNLLVTIPADSINSSTLPLSTLSWDSFQTIITKNNPFNLTSYSTSSILPATLNGTSAIYLTLSANFNDSPFDNWQISVITNNLYNIPNKIYSGGFGSCPPDTTYEHGVLALEVLSGCPASCASCADNYLVTFTQNKMSECWADNEISYDMYYPLQIDSSTNSNFGLSGLSLVLTRNDDGCVWSTSATINETAYTYLNNMCAGTPNNTASANYDITVQLHCEENQWVVEIQDLGFRYTGLYLTESPDLTMYTGGVTVT